MKLKLLVPSVLALSVLAVPALAYVYPDNQVPITGSQMTDRPSERSNVTVSGSLLRPETGYVARDDYYYGARSAYEQGYRDGYRDRDYDTGR